MPVKHARNPVAGVDRDGAFFHDHAVAIHGARNLHSYGLDVGEVGVAVFHRRRAHGDEDGFGRTHGVGQRSAEGERTLLLPLQQCLQMIFVDGDLAVLQSRDFGCVVVDANHGVADLGEAHCRDQADISAADNRNIDWRIHWLRWGNRRNVFSTCFVID